MDNYGFLSLLPPIIAIFLAIRTKQVFISLLTGIFIGWLIIGGWNPLKGILFTKISIGSKLQIFLKSCSIVRSVDKATTPTLGFGVFSIMGVKLI